MKPNMFSFSGCPSLREIDFNLLDSDGTPVFNHTVYWHFVNGLEFKCAAEIIRIDKRKGGAI